MPKPNPNLLAANAAAGYPQPILYLPLSDPTQPGKNLGTGGDFALNGVVARSGRGPSQFNAPYSDLDGAADYLSRTSRLTGLVAGKQFTVQYCVNSDAGDGGALCFHNGTDTSFDIRVGGTGNALVQIYDSGGVLSALSSVVRVPGRNYVVSISIDMSDTNKRHIVINGVADSSVMWTNYLNSNLSYATPANCSVGAYRSSGSWLPLNGRLGNVFFDTRYIDLSQPDNLAKFVTGTGIDAKPADLGANGEKPFGTPPLIYLPMYGNNAGKNYGTGGDFTVVSGPFAGSRGPNEFWGNKADFDGTTGYLSRTSALSGVSDGKTFSASFAIQPDAFGSNRGIFDLRLQSNADSGVRISTNSSGNLLIVARNAANDTLLSATSSSTLASGQTNYVHISIDLTNSSKRYVYVNGSVFTMTWSVYTDGIIDLDGLVINIGRMNPATPLYFDGKLSEFYFTTDYIDFSQEANRLKFRDAFGNPVDLQPQIDAGTLPNPAIYMRFDPSNFGKNDGTGGDFVVNGTITDGGQL